MSLRPTRRDCLKSAALAATALVGSSTKPASAEERAAKMTGYIDAHVHVWTPDTDRYSLAPGYAKENMKPPSFTPEQLFAHARPVGVDRINLIQMSFYGFDNAYMLDMIDKYPDNFVGTAIVDPLGPDPDGDMLKLVPRKVRAFRIHPAMSKQPPKTWLTPPGYEKMFAAAAKHRLALSPLIDVDALPELDRMCSRHPDAPIIIDHLCRIGVGDKFPMNEENITALANMARHRNVYLKIGAFYALGKRTPPYLDMLPMIRRMVEAFGPHRCMWETDCPFQVANHKYEDSIALIRDHADFLSPADKTAILRTTAEKLLFRTA